MDREELKKKFPSYFPIDKLPDGAREQEFEVYRICKYGFTDNSFLTSYEEDNKFNRKEKMLKFIDDIGYYSMSCFVEEKDILSLHKLIGKRIKNLIIAKGITSKNCGVSQMTKEREIDKNNSHVDFWLYSEAKPIEHFYEVSIV